MRGRVGDPKARVSLLCSAFVFCIWRVSYPSCCQYWKDIHSYPMKAKYFVVLSTGVNWYVTMKTSGVLHSILQLVFATYDCSIRKNVTIRLLMHRNALFEAVHNFPVCFMSYSFVIFFSLSVMGINDYKTDGESHKHLFTSVKLYLQLFYSPCHRTLTLHCIITFLNKSCAKLNE